MSKQQSAAGVRASSSSGPTGKVMATGEIDEQRVTDAFRTQAEALAEGGADVLLFETFSDVEEARLAVQAAKPTGLPIIVSFAFDSGRNKDRTMMGVTPETAARAMVEEGVDAIGANCGAGPESFAQICRRLKDASGLPVWIKPNAGMPSLKAGQAVYTMTADTFASHLPALIEAWGVVSGRLLRHEPRVRSCALVRVAASWSYPPDRLRGDHPRALCDAVERSPHVVDARFLSKGLHDRVPQAMAARASRPPSMRPRLTPGNTTPSRWDMDYAVRARPGWRPGPSPWFSPALYDCITLLMGSRIEFPNAISRTIRASTIARPAGSSAGPTSEPLAATQTAWAIPSMP